MNREFIKSTMQTAVYRLKEGTKGSYYWLSGSQILPNRISLSIGSELSRVQKKGRNLQDIIAGQLISKYKNSEVSPLKRYKPYCCRTQIWKKVEYPALFGYGTLGISNEEGMIIDTKDLIVLNCSADLSLVRIYVFNGLGTPDNLLEAIGYADELERSLV